MLIGKDEYVEIGYLQFMRKIGWKDSYPTKTNPTPSPKLWKHILANCILHLAFFQMDDKGMVRNCEGQ